MHNKYFEVLVWALFYLVIQDDAVLLLFFSPSAHEKRILVAKQLSSYTNIARQLLFFPLQTIQHRSWAGWLVPGNLQLLAGTDGLQREVLQLFVRIPESRGEGCSEGRSFSVRCHPSPQITLGVLTWITLTLSTSGNLL